MLINLTVTYTDGTTKELTGVAADLVAFESKFDVSIAKLEKMTHMFWIAWHIEHRTGATKKEFEAWTEEVASAEFGDPKK